MEHSKFKTLLFLSVWILQLMLLGTVIYNLLTPFESNTIFRAVLAFMIALIVTYTLRKLLKRVIFFPRHSRKEAFEQTFFESIR
jgi:Na+/glutamate symporter